VLPLEFKQWFGEHAVPLQNAVINGDEALARECYSRALASLDSEADMDIRQAKHLRIRLAWFTALVELRRRSEAAGEIEALLADCAAPQAGALSADLARICDVLGRLRADRADMLALEPARMPALLSALSEENQGPNYWYEVGNWAFKNGKQALLEEAYAYFTTQRPSTMGVYVFMKCRLMVHLLEKNAVPENLRRCIEAIEIPAQMADLEETVLNACSQAGLIDPSISLLLGAKREELKQAGVGTEAVQR
jgi:hypothetical protein